MEKPWIIGDMTISRRATDSVLVQLAYLYSWRTRTVGILVQLAYLHSWRTRTVGVLVQLASWRNRTLSGASPFQTTFVNYFGPVNANRLVTT